jgi:hypothetical protein
MRDFPLDLTDLLRELRISLYWKDLDTRGIGLQVDEFGEFETIVPFFFF